MKCDPNLYRATTPSLAVKPRLIRHLFLPPLIIILMVGLGYAGFWISERFGIRSLSENGQRQLELNARAVESEISKYTYLPSLLELESSVSQLLGDPTPEHRQTVNDYLEGLNRRSRSRAIYVMDTTGRSWPPATGATSTVTSAKTCPSAPTFRKPCVASPDVSTITDCP